MVDLVLTEEEHDALSHYGIKRKSGRYPWGSGPNSDTPTQRSQTFVGMVNDLRRQGMTDSEIAKSFSDPDDPKNPFTTTKLRATTTIARNEIRAANIAQAERLKAKQMSNGEIAKRMNLAGESSVRALLDPGAKIRGDELNSLAQVLRDQVAQKGLIDVGVGNEHYLQTTDTQLKTAVAMLESEGYNLHPTQVPQLGTNNKTTVKVLAPQGAEFEGKAGYIYVKQNQDKIQTIGAQKTDDASGYTVLKKPLAIDQNRVGINYSKTNAKGEEIGGANSDGVIFVRPGVDDVTLGGTHYSQVRIQVGKDHYLKGMAIYKDGLPEGVDLVFNTNKSDTGNKLDAMKKIDKTAAVYTEENPFGSSISRQILNKTETKATSVMNIVNDAGEWGEWSKNIATQVLSKQQPVLAKEQLAKLYKRKAEDFAEINGLTNPAVKRELLRSFADDMDSSSVHLKAAAMDRQLTQVIMPVPKMRETEVFAPNFKDGERVVLIRYPHGGKFEIPELTVNNRNPEAIKLLKKDAKDAIGISPKVAERLSGADFDGDTVLVIPNNAGRIKSEPALERLKGFNPKIEYGPFDGMRTIDGGQWNAAKKEVEFEVGKSSSGRMKQTKMGDVSNLITDMTIKGASNNEIVRAVRHSMVVIDAEKHHLNVKQSALDHGIAQLKDKYQREILPDGSVKTGASTLISRTSRETSVPNRKQAYKIDPDTGEKVYTYTGEGYFTKPRTLKNGNVVEPKFIPSMTKSKEGAEVKDAHELSSGTPIERIYADHSNKLKALANEARLAKINVVSTPYSPTAKKVYAKEVAELNADLKTALRNAPKERQAQLVANAKVRLIKDANPNMSKDDVKKLNGRALVEARNRVGAGKTKVPISDTQWEAIQAGAISNAKLESILKNADLDRVKELATPRQATVMTDAKQGRARALLASGRTASEVAAILGVALSTLTSSVNGKD